MLCVSYDKLARGVRIRTTCERQQRQLAGSGLVRNADMDPAQIREFCTWREDTQALVRVAMRQMHLSARAYHRVLKVARTIADLEGTEGIQTHHLAEALPYRPQVLKM